MTRFAFISLEPGMELVFSTSEHCIFQTRLKLILLFCVLIFKQQKPCLLFAVL